MLTTVYYQVMKRILVGLLTTLICVSAVSGQDGFSYQAVIRQADGTLVIDTQVGMRFTLYADTVKCYQETQTVTTDSYGKATAVIGGKESQKLSGSFSQVPWQTMSVMLEVEADVNGGGTYVNYGKTPVQAVPYARYASSAPVTTEITGSAEAGEESELFSVKDKDGNVVFAVYPSGVRVYVNDADSSKAMARGFVVSGRKATKDGEPDLLVIDETGTRVYVDADESKAMAKGFAVSGRKATKDGETDNVFTVDGSGTQVFIDADSSKAMAKGFAVSGRKATKSDESDKYFTIGSEGTTVYVDSDSSKAMAKGFAVSGRKATKDGEADNVFTVDGTGTQVYIATDESKAMARGFAVSGRKATKDGEGTYLTVDNAGTTVFVDTEDGKAMAKGFAVSGRKATKDSEVDNIFIVDAAGTQAFIDDDGSKAMARGFAVSGHKATKANPFNGDYLSISDTMTMVGVKGSNEEPSLAFKDKYSDDTVAYVSENMLTIMGGMQVTGDIEYRDYVAPDTLFYDMFVPCKWVETCYISDRKKSYDLISLSLMPDIDHDNLSVELIGANVTDGEYKRSSFSARCLRGSIEISATLSDKRQTLDDTICAEVHSGHNVVTVKIAFHCRVVDESLNFDLFCYKNADGEYKGTDSLVISDIMGDDYILESVESADNDVIKYYVRNNNLYYDYSLKNVADCFNKGGNIILHAKGRSIDTPSLDCALDVRLHPVDSLPYVDVYVPFIDVNNTAMIDPSLLNMDYDISSFTINSVSNDNFKINGIFPDGISVEYISGDAGVLSTIAYQDDYYENDPKSIKINFHYSLVSGRDELLIVDSISPDNAKNYKVHLKNESLETYEYNVVKDGETIYCIIAKDSDGYKAQKSVKDGPIEYYIQNNDGEWEESFIYFSSWTAILDSLRSECYNYKVKPRESNYNGHKIKTVYSRPYNGGVIYTFEDDYFVYIDGGDNVYEVELTYGDNEFNPDSIAEGESANVDF